MLALLSRKISYCTERVALLLSKTSAASDPLLLLNFAWSNSRERYLALPRIKTGLDPLVESKEVRSSMKHQITHRLGTRLNLVSVLVVASGVVGTHMHADAEGADPARFTSDAAAFFMSKTISECPNKY